MVEMMANPSPPSSSVLKQKIRPPLVNHSRIHKRYFPLHLGVNHGDDRLADTNTVIALAAPSLSHTLSLDKWCRVDLGSYGKLIS